jgi:hypothetical protein
MIKHAENGNALFFILIAVALIAALTAVVTRSSDTAEQSGNIERFRVEASDIMKVAGGMKQAVNNMRLRGTSESELSFNNTFLSATLYTNTNCTNGDCAVYGLGGGQAYKVPARSWLNQNQSASPQFGTWEFSGENHVDNIETTDSELIAYLGHLNRGLCRQINAMLGIPEVSGDVPNDADGFTARGFTGGFNDDTGDSNYGVINNMSGAETGCFNSAARDYTFYQVLIAR